MRADRLVAELLILQARGRITAAQLAEELEVSERTARRDLEALSMAGIPVYSQAGRGGGWSLIGGARTDLSGLTATEARTLFLIAGPSSAATPEAKSALRKLVQALPETFRLGRVRSVDPTSDPVDRPRDFDLASAWQKVVEAMDEKWPSTTVRALADPRMVRILRMQWGRDLTVHDVVDPDGRVAVSIAGR